MVGSGRVKGIKPVEQPEKFGSGRVKILQIFLIDPRGSGRRLTRPYEHP